MPSSLLNDLEIYKEAKREGKTPIGVGMDDYLQAVNNYVKNNPPPEYLKEVEGVGDVPTEVVDQVKGKTPTEFFEYMRTDKPVEPTQVPSLARQINESQNYPYRAVATKGDVEGSELGFIRDVDRYEMAYDSMRNPVYLKYYKDGSHKSIDEGMFNKQKGFNLLPESVKKQYGEVIDEQDLSSKNKAVIRKNIQGFNVNDT